jgi:hypothetical protein
MPSISARTRRVFQEHLVGFILRDIRGFFGDAGLIEVDVPGDQLPGGERRALVARFYAGVNWASPEDTERVLRAYQYVINETGAEYRDGPIQQLRSDGIDVGDDGTIRTTGSALDVGTPGRSGGARSLRAADAAEHRVGS